MSSFPPAARDDLQQFVQLYSTIHIDSWQNVDDDKLFEGCFKGMAASLDDGSEHFDRKAYADLRADLTGRISAIGIEYNMVQGLPRVSKILPEGGAEAAGLQRRDVILAIDGQSTDEQSSETIGNNLRGAAGSQATLLVRHFDDPVTRSVIVTRGPMAPRSPVHARMLQSGVAYINIAQLRFETTAKVVSSYATLFSSGVKINGLILDLRNNPGGLLDEARYLASLFLNSGDVVFVTRGRLAEANRSYVVDGTLTSQNGADMPRFDSAILANLKSIPLVILINKFTASGSELVAGAIQDHKRGTIAGETSFGRGSVQVIVPDTPKRVTGLKLTISQVNTPNGHGVEKTGIRPDIALTPLASTEFDPDVDDAWTIQAVRVLTSNHVTS